MGWHEWDHRYEILFELRINVSRRSLREIDKYQGVTIIDDWVEDDEMFELLRKPIAKSSMGGKP